MAGLSLAILVMILFNANQSTASVWPKRCNSSSTSTSTFQYCNGSMQDCPIAEDENVVFLFDLEIELSFQIEACFIPIRPAVNCGRGRSYTSCLPDPQNSKIIERCSRLYINRNRGCAQFVVSLIKFIKVLMYYVMSNLFLFVHACLFDQALATSTAGAIHVIQLIKMLPTF